MNIKWRIIRFVGTQLILLSVTIPTYACFAVHGDALFRRTPNFGPPRRVRRNRLSKVDHILHHAYWNAEFINRKSGLSWSKGGNTILPSSPDTIIYTYDSLNRLIKVEYADG